MLQGIGNIGSWLECDSFLSGSLNKVWKMVSTVEGLEGMILTPWYDSAEEISKPNNPFNGLR